MSLNFYFKFPICGKRNEEKEERKKYIYRYSYKGFFDVLDNFSSIKVTSEGQKWNKGGQTN